MRELRPPKTDEGVHSVSRTPKHDTKRGPLAYGEGHKQRGDGYEFWGSRSGKQHGESPGPFTKKKTHRHERRQGRAQERLDEE